MFEFDHKVLHQIPILNHLDVRCIPVFLVLTEFTEQPCGKTPRIRLHCRILTAKP